MGTEVQFGKTRKFWRGMEVWSYSTVTGRSDVKLCTHQGLKWPTLCYKGFTTIMKKVLK